MTYSDDTPLDIHERHRLRWRSRRGLVENDLYLEHFFNTHGPQLTQRHAAAITSLMELSDNDLMDLFLRRTEPQAELNTPVIKEVLEMVRKPL